MARRRPRRGQFETTPGATTTVCGRPTAATRAAARHSGGGGHPRLPLRQLPPGKTEGHHHPDDLFVKITLTSIRNTVYFPPCIPEQLIEQVNTTRQPYRGQKTKYKFALLKILLGPDNNYVNFIAKFKQLTGILKKPHNNVAAPQPLLGVL